MKFKLIPLMLVSWMVSATAFAWDYNECCPCEDSCWYSGFYFQYENVIARPYFSRNNAYFLEDPDALQGQTAVQFDWDYEYSYRIELGWNRCGIGMRSRYWHFDNDITLEASNAAGEIASWFGEDSLAPDIGFQNATRADFRHRVEMDVVDIEAEFIRPCWIYSIGTRYARIDQRYVANEIAPAVNAFEATLNFEGWGLTNGFDAFQPIWCNLSLFAKGRGSILFGQSGFAAVNLIDPAAQIRSTNPRHVIAVGEVLVGFDWTQCICSYETFFRFAFEGQYWIGGGSGGPGDNAVYDEGNYQNSNPQDSNLGFFGFNIAIGMNF